MTVQNGRLRGEHRRRRRRRRWIRRAQSHLLLRRCPQHLEDLSSAWTDPHPPVRITLGRGSSFHPSDTLHALRHHLFPTASASTGTLSPLHLLPFLPSRAQTLQPSPRLLPLRSTAPARCTGTENLTQVLAHRCHLQEAFTHCGTPASHTWGWI